MGDQVDDHSATASPGKAPQRKNGTHYEWTDFEMTAVLALLCKGVHRDQGGALTFATELNQALNRGRFHDHDLDVNDVAELLAWIEREKPHALQFIERQMPQRLTRAAARVFKRTDLDFEGTAEEWFVGGRREREMAAGPERLRRWAEAQAREKERKAARARGEMALDDTDARPSIEQDQDADVTMRDSAKEGEEEGEILDNVRQGRGRESDASRVQSMLTAHPSMATLHRLPPRPPSPARHKSNDHVGQLLQSGNSRLQSDPGSLHAEPCNRSGVSSLRAHATEARSSTLHRSGHVRPVTPKIPRSLSVQGGVSSQHAMTTVGGHFDHAQQPQETGEHATLHRDSHHPSTSRPYSDGRGSFGDVPGSDWREESRLQASPPCHPLAVGGFLSDTDRELGGACRLEGPILDHAAGENGMDSRMPSVPSASALAQQGHMDADRGLAKYRAVVTGQIVGSRGQLHPDRLRMLDHNGH